MENRSEEIRIMGKMKVESSRGKISSSAKSKEFKPWIREKIAVSVTK